MRACTRMYTQEREGLHTGTQQQTRVEKKRMGRIIKPEIKIQSHVKRTSVLLLSRVLGKNSTVFTNVLCKEHFSTGDGLAWNMKHYQGCWKSLGLGQEFLPKSWLPGAPALWTQLWCPVSVTCKAGPFLPALSAAGFDTEVKIRWWWPCRRCIQVAWA